MLIWRHSCKENILCDHLLSDLLADLQYQTSMSTSDNDFSEIRNAILQKMDLWLIQDEVTPLKDDST